MAKALLIYTQRHKPPNKPLTPSKNQAHISYIGTRPGVMKHEDCDNGLFGVLGGSFHDRFLEDTEAKAQVYALSKQKKTMFRSVISFTEQQAEGLGLYKLEDWQVYVKSHMRTIAERNNIHVMDLEYVAAVHMKKNQPHVHITFWDKSESVQRQFVSKALVQQLRGQLIKDTYPELHQQYVSEKNITEKELRESFETVMKGYEDYLLSMPSNEYLLYKDDIKSNEKKQQSCFTAKDYAESSEVFVDIGRSILAARSNLPKSGRLVYKLLPPENKGELDEIVERLIASHEKFGRAVENFVGSRLDIAEMYTSDEKDLEGKRRDYHKEARTIIANIILSSLKNLDTNIASSETAFSSAPHDFQGLLRDILFLLGTQTDRNRRVENDLANSFGQLGVVARNEYLRKLRDRGIGVER